MEDREAVNEPRLTPLDAGGVDTHWSRILHVDIFNGEGKPRRLRDALAPQLARLARYLVPTRRHVDESRACVARAPQRA